MIRFFACVKYFFIFPSLKFILLRCTTPAPEPKVDPRSSIINTGFLQNPGCLPFPATDNRPGVDYLITKAPREHKNNLFSMRSLYRMYRQMRMDQAKRRPMLERSSLRSKQAIRRQQQHSSRAMLKECYPGLRKSIVLLVGTSKWS
jgi:hypothetical protein